MERYRFARARVAQKSVLDIACGAGYAAPLLMVAGAASYDGVDLNERLVAYDTETYGSDKVRFTAGDICTYSPGRSYDVITCFETIEHVSDHRAALKNVFALLSPGGTLLISSPNRPVTSPKARALADRPSNAFHVQEFTPAELISDLRSAGFTLQPGEVYGQRQRVHHSSWLMRKLSRMLHGNPDKTTSAEVRPLTGLTPRYFILVATRAV